MGLDDFSSDDSDNTNDSESEASATNTTEDDEEEESGLSAFKTSSSSSSTKSEKDREPANPWMDDFTADEWNSMTSEEKVSYIRENYIPDYRPEIQLDDRWDWSPAIEIHCVCGESFTMKIVGTCLSCGRKYKKAGKIVTLIDEPTED